MACTVVGDGGGCVRVEKELLIGRCEWVERADRRRADLVLRAVQEQGQVSAPKRDLANRLMERESECDLLLKESRRKELQATGVPDLIQKPLGLHTHTSGREPLASFLREDRVWPAVYGWSAFPLNLPMLAMVQWFDGKQRQTLLVYLTVNSTDASVSSALFLSSLFSSSQAFLSCSLLSITPISISFYLSAPFHTCR